MTDSKTLKAGDRTVPYRGHETIDKIKEADLSEFSTRITQDATVNDANRIRSALQEDDLIWAQTNRSFKDILRLLPIEDFDRETLELDRGYLTKRCERAKTLMMFTNELSDVRKYVRLKAKIAVIDLILSAEVGNLIDASLQHLEN
jgi:hypothetical protein